MAGIDERIIDANAQYFGGETVPQNTTTSSSALRTGEAGQLGATKVLVRAKTLVSVADTKTITITVQESADGSTGWATISSKAYLSSGAATYAAGLELHEFILPRTVLEYTRVQIITDDVAATGTIDAFCSSAVGVGKFR